jgi:hypothetical protein
MFLAGLKLPPIDVGVRLSDGRWQCSMMPGKGCPRAFDDPIPVLTIAFSRRP